MRGSGTTLPGVWRHLYRDNFPARQENRCRQESSIACRVALFCHVKQSALKAGKLGTVHDASKLGRRLDAWIDDHIDMLLGFTSALVRIPTENKPPYGAELAGQLHLKQELERAGAEVDMYELSEVPGLTEHPAFMAGRHYENRPNVVGRFRGKGGGRSLCFSSHMDTAPQDPVPWVHTSPFSGEVREGKLWGRGSFDMKGGLAASFVATLAARAVAGPLRGDVFIESVVDEEWAGSNGTLAARLRGPNADAAILPEPTDLEICPEHLGCRLYRLTVPGSSGMVFGNPNLRNPIYTAYRFVEALQGFAAEYAAGPKPPLYEGVPAPPSFVTAIEARQYGVPRHCVLDFAISFYKHHTGEQVHAWVEALVQKAFAGVDVGSDRVVLEPLYRVLPGSAMPSDHPLLDVLLEASHGVPGAPGVVKGAPLQCDAYMFNLYSNTPAVIMGPSGANAHTADEYVDVDSLIKLTRIFARSIVAWCS